MLRNKLSSAFLNVNRSSYRSYATINKKPPIPIAVQEPSIRKEPPTKVEKQKVILVSV